MRKEIPEVQCEWDILIELIREYIVVDSIDRQKEIYKKSDVIQIEKRSLLRCIM